MKSTVAAKPAIMKALGDPVLKSRMRFLSLCTPNAADRVLPTVCQNVGLPSALPDGVTSFIAIQNCCGFARPKLYFRFSCSGST